MLPWLIIAWLWRKALNQSITGLKIKEIKKEIKTEKKVTAGRELIKKSCFAHDPRLTHQAIFNWAAATWPQNSPTNLKKLAAMLENNELEKAFTDLKDALYSPVSIENWDGNQFWQLIAKNLRKPNPRKTSGKKNRKLPPLYSHMAK